MTFALAYLMTALVFFLIDYVWLTRVAKAFYAEQLGDLMKKDIGYAVAGGFYALYVVGIVYFCVVPALDTGSWGLAALNGALLGLLAYGTYDLTNLATIKNWPVAMSIVDMAWGTALTSVAATAGFGLTSLVTSAPA